MLCEKNLALIGMPGCGKSVVGRALADRLGWLLIDSDEEIVRRMGKSIPRIFQEGGEAAFREMERAMVAEMAGGARRVLATGGGTALDARNVHALRATGIVIFLRRPLALLATEGRPLSANLAEMAAVRIPLYRTACDLAVDNDGTIDEAAEKIIRAIWGERVSGSPLPGI